MDGCDLCNKFINTIKPDSSLRKCLNGRCPKKFFHATPNELIKYYISFLRTTLTSEGNRLLLSKKFSSRFSRDGCYVAAWEYFMEETINNRDNLGISRIGVYYSKGIGIKRSYFMADLLFALAEKYRSSPTLSIFLGEVERDRCPVCYSNPDNGEGSYICETCGNMVCGFCYKRLSAKSCPSCTRPFSLDVGVRIRRLKEMVSKRRGRNIENAKVFLAKLILDSKNENHSQAYILLSESVLKGCIRGYVVLAMMYLSGKGCIHNIPTGIKILETGIRKGDIDCMKQLGKMYYNGEFVKKNKSKGIDFYKLAALNGSVESLIYLGKIK